MRRGLQLITARAVITSQSEASITQSDQSEASNHLVTYKLFAKSQCQGVRVSDLCWNDDMQMIFDRTQRDTFNGVRLEIGQTDGHTNNGTVNLNKTNQAETVIPASLA